MLGLWIRTINMNEPFKGSYCYFAPSFDLHSSSMEYLQGSRLVISRISDRNEAIIANSNQLLLQCPSQKLLTQPSLRSICLWIKFVFWEYTLLSYPPEAHNENEEEGKGRSVKHPSKRLKFQIFPTVVTLLSLEQRYNMHGTNQPLLFTLHYYNLPGYYESSSDTCNIGRQAATN